jgi:hypothetical protein
MVVEEREKKKRKMSRMGQRKTIRREKVLTQNVKYDREKYWMWYEGRVQLIFFFLSQNQKVPI